MTGPLRRAGRGFDGHGTEVIWTVSEGRRGRRWREVRSGPDGVISSLLLETDPTGRFSHAEISTSAGLLTLHPEADGTLHGNVVGGRGIHHVEGLAWDEDGVVLLEGSTIAAAAAIGTTHRADRTGSADPAAGVPAVFIDERLRLSTRVVGFAPVAGGWLVGDAVVLHLDGNGLPVLGEGATWALERDA